MLAIFTKELKTYFTSLFAYIYYGVYFLLTGILFVVNCLSTYSTQFGYYVLSSSFFVVVAVIPFCTMQLFAGERRNKTDQLLFTAPVSTFSILVGKYLATAVYVLLPIIISVVYPIVIATYGEMSVRFLISAYIGVFLTVFVLLSIGMFISSLTTNAIVAAVMTYAVYVLILIGRLVEGILSAGGSFNTVIHEISIYNKFYDLTSGIVRSGDVLYLLLLTIAFFILTWFVLEGRRQSGKKIAGYMVALVAIVIVIGTVVLANTKVYDFTAEQLLTFSEDTKQVLAETDKPTEIYYMGLRSRANATYQEFLAAYEEMSDNITVEYVDVENNSAFRTQYLSNMRSINEASMLVVCGEKSVYLDSNDYIAYTQTTAYSYESKLKMEEQLTRAILYTNTEETYNLYVVSGHGEETLNSNFQNLLRLNNYEIEELNFSSALSSIEQVIPDKCTALFINAPQIDFSEAELAELKDYLEDGGNLFVVIDPLVEDAEQLYGFLKQYGLEVSSGVIIEQEQGRYVYDTPYYLMPQIQDTEYTKEFLKDKLVVLTMTSKGIVKNGKANGYVATDILTTSSIAFSKTSNFDSDDITTKADGDISGPFSVASCATNPNEGSLFLLTSNIFFNEDADAESQGANRRFFIEILNQLTDAEAGVWIDGKDVGNQVALYPNTKQGTVKILTIIVVPVVIFIVGILVIWVRKKGVLVIRGKKGVNEEKTTHDA